MSLLRLATIHGYTKVVGGKTVHVKGYQTAKQWRGEIHNASSNKFYESSVITHPDGSASHIVRFGSTLPGKTPQEQKKKFSSLHDALVAHAAKMSDKINKSGYGAGAATKPFDEERHHVLAAEGEAGTGEKPMSQAQQELARLLAKKKGA